LLHHGGVLLTTSGRQGIVLHRVFMEGCSTSGEAFSVSHGDDRLLYNRLNKYTIRDKVNKHDF
jgi:hypothetical protein